MRGRVFVLVREHVCVCASVCACTGLNLPRSPSHPRRAPPPRSPSPRSRSPSALAALMSASHVVTSIPPAGLPLYDPVTRGQLALLRARARAAAEGAAPPLRWLGVLSSTSVYGDHGGDWVDEE
jgi:hypothetical protein